MSRTQFVVVISLTMGASDSAAAELPKLIAARVQSVGDETYFHLRFERPANLWLPLRLRTSSFRETVGNLARLPRLVPQDPNTREVALYWHVFEGEPVRSVMPAELEFAGRISGKGTARFLLLSAETPADYRWPNPVKSQPEQAIEIDFDRAQVRPARAARGPGRDDSRQPENDDLQSIWAYSMATHFAVLNTQSPGFGFYRVAQTAIDRRYGVKSTPVESLESRALNPEYQRLYDTTTGAAAITESLQVARMLRTGRKEGPRDIDIAKVPGIDIAEHPWQQMMAGKKPDDEPLARLIPHDNYFITFKSLSKFLEMGDVIGEWGTVATRMWESRSADYRIRERYEKQLCLKTTLLGRTLGPLVIRSVAVTGNDFYLREGSDLAVIFDVANRDLFRTAVQPYIDEARKEFGTALREERSDYHGVAIESLVSPRREVSVHRAFVGDFVVLANSPVGIRRILDAGNGRIPALAASGDFQYMRTVFLRSDATEDGFAFLSDAFIRKLVGPASKIAEKRRLEGLAGVHLLTHAALWHAWNTGNLPADRDAALRSAGLESADLRTPDQLDVGWNGIDRVAVSDRYNTNQFATPLIETPVDRATKEEAEDYREFRLRYLGLWRQYFDPVGMRFQLTPDRIHVETYILPLIQSTQYARLRQLTGNGTIARNVSPPTAGTVLQLSGHLAPDARERREFEDGISVLGVKHAVGWLGNWWVIRFDDSPMYAKFARLEDHDANPLSNPDEWTRTVFQMPITLGVEIRNPLTFAGVLASLRSTLLNALPGAVAWEPMEPEYKGVKIVRIQATKQGVQRYLNQRDNAEPFLPAIYYALVDGAWYASLQLQPIKDMIDRAAERKVGGPDAAEPQINSSLYLSPTAGVATKQYLRELFGREDRKQSAANAAIWHAFFQMKLIDTTTPNDRRQDLLYRILGYAPVNGDGSDWGWDERLGEVANNRHGSLRRPANETDFAAVSSARRLLEQFATIQVDLRFREDGIHTIVALRKTR